MNDTEAATDRPTAGGQVYLDPIPEAQRRLGGIGRVTLYELINRGELTRVKIGARAFITRDSLDAYLGRLIRETAGASA